MTEPLSDAELAGIRDNEWPFAPTVKRLLATIDKLTAERDWFKELFEQLTSDPVPSLPLESRLSLAVEGLREIANDRNDLSGTRGGSHPIDIARRTLAKIEEP